MKKIAKIEVISSGSPPDVDSDFHTEFREKAIEHVGEVYGKDNVANIVTFGTLAGKAAFKQMCTIYEVNFAQANKITSLYPPMIEGVSATLEDIYNPDSDRYAEGADFREAVSGKEWEKIIKGARAIEGRNKSTGVHACGIIISNVPLSEAIPLHVRQSDQRTITQWTYPECESLGLLKMDFLGLDTVDLVQNAVQNIVKSGKTPPNMIDLIHGPMNDPKVYNLFQEGHTVGIFQFGSDMVQQLLLLTKPTEFADLPAITSVARPGPMGMLSHTKYADRKNGREEVDYIHPEFKGTVMEEILGKTQGLVIYQEQVQQISNRIAGMTLQEGDDLRRAMGKKKKKVMDAMKPKFYEGAIANGFSEEAITVLWDTLEPFAKYGFNKSHAVAYAMNSYQSAYLKVHYPVEFMAALIAQHVDNKDKTLLYLRDASRMGLKVGSADINLSESRVAPNYAKKNKEDKDIIFGLSGIKSVSSKMAEIIIEERERNGLYASVKDLIDRCFPLGVDKRTVYENLALAGAFDGFGVSRKKTFENIVNLMDTSKTKVKKGESLFDMFEIEDESLEVDLDGEDYPFLAKLKREAEMVGLYLTAHPTDKLGNSVSKEYSQNISKLLSSSSSKPIRTTIVASVLGIDIKRSKRGAKTVLLDLDDGSGFMTANVGKQIVMGIDKYNAQQQIKTAYESGKTDTKQEVLDKAVDSEVFPMKNIEKYDLYVMDITYRPAKEDSPYRAQINSLKHLQLADNGTLPVRIRFRNTESNKDKMAKLEKVLPFNLGKKMPGEYPIYIASYSADDLLVDDKVLYETAYDIAKLDNEGTTHVWPPEIKRSSGKSASREDLVNAIENLTYVNSGYSTDKNQKVEQAIEKYVGYGAYDFGVFNPNSLDED